MRIGKHNQFKILLALGIFIFSYGTMTYGQNDPKKEKIVWTADVASSLSAYLSREKLLRSVRENPFFVTSFMNSNFNLSFSYDRPVRFSNLNIFQPFYYPPFPRWNDYNKYFWNSSSLTNLKNSFNNWPFRDSFNGIESQIRQWELDASTRLSDFYVSELVKKTDPWVGLWADVTLGLEQNLFRDNINTQLNLANLYRNLQGLPTLGAHPSAWAAEVFGFATTGMSSAVNFFQTVDYLGTSMQIMNPPIYLDRITPFGSAGAGMFSIPGGRGFYQEKLFTGDPGPIVRWHDDQIFTAQGVYDRTITIKTPATSGFERFMLHHFPLGNYFDPETSIMTYETKYRPYNAVEVLSNMNKISSVSSPISGLWSQNALENSWKWNGGFQKMVLSSRTQEYLNNLGQRQITALKQFGQYMNNNSFSWQNYFRWPTFNFSYYNFNFFNRFNNFSFKRF
jgi:hypothetical protein